MSNEIIKTENNKLLDYDNLQNIEKHIETYKKYLNIPNATKEDIAFFSQYCQKTQLDPVSRQIYAISYYDDKNKKNKIQVLLSIDGYRIIAQRTGDFDSSETFWCGEDGVWKDVWLSSKNPSAAKVIVYKRNSQKGISAVALFKEYANLKSNTWQTKPVLMIAKCAESLALRKAFPSALSGLYTSEEMSNSDIVKNSYNQNKNNVKSNIDNSTYDINKDVYIIDDAEQYDTVPFGNNKGKKWLELGTETLKKALEYIVSKKLNDNYINVINDILAIREIENKEENVKELKTQDIKIELDKEENPFGANEEERKAWDGSIGNNRVDGTINNEEGLF